MNSLVIDEAGKEILAKQGKHRLMRNTKNGYWYIDFYTERKLISLHRFLMQAPKGSFVDHINGNKQDNRFCNLRFCSRGENTLNRPKQSSRKCGYKGVTKNTGVETYTARALGKYLGSFKTQKEAALAYDEYVLKHHPDFAFLNFPVSK